MSDARSQLVDVCKLGGGEECCRFLVMGADFTCAKLSGTAATINARVEAGSFTAKGDNCDGLEFGTAITRDPL